MTESKQYNMSNSSSLNRRSFLRKTVQTGALLAMPMVLPASVLGLDGKISPNDKITLGGIGVGNRGSDDLRYMLRLDDVRFVAICDAKKTQREKIKEFVDNRYDNKDCTMYSDFREFLAERKDIDAVLIATGDRWHAVASVMAMRAGKDVYSEKPSSFTIAEGQAVVDTAARYGRIYQTGVQRLNVKNFVFANEVLRLGRLGKVHTVRAHIAPWDPAYLKYDWLPEEPLPSKEEMDWDQWLGPCPWRPYNAAYPKGSWRGYYDFHTGCIGDWGAHTFAQCQYAIGQAHTAAIRYRYVNNDFGDGMVTTFPNGIKMVLHRDLENKYWHGTCGVRYEGDEGWVSVADGYEKPEGSSSTILSDFDKIINEYAERTGRPVNDPRYVSDGLTPVGHVIDFFDSVRTRRQAIANPTVMHTSMTTVHAANICMWLKRDLRFNPKKQRFYHDSEANRLRSRAQREPWII